MNKSIYASIALVAVSLGLMIAFQYRTTSSVEQGVPYGREQELTAEKIQLEKDLEHLQEESADLSAKLDEAGKGQSEAARAIKSELSKIKLYAGLIPVEGPGVEVSLENLSDPKQGGSAELYTIKDDDLLRVINELRGAGAEAIAINNQRILATSEVRLAGSHIVVNMVKLSPPYKVAAIGNATTLKSSLEIKGGLAEFLGDLGITVKVNARDNILIPAFTGGLRFDYAKTTQRG
ncbi:MAG: hypothetical protein A4E53_02003 [Pelotomaculum sp. PtaB.Bin104]|nr:MAG: hypothetical protein A4E53_02003 [Pelotomaculum sp. PtaB.Bin104]